VKSLGDRIKDNYENRYRMYLTRRVPVIIRVDGKSFHSVLNGLKKPFDDKFMKSMDFAAYHTSREMQGFRLGYVQSDEASFLLTDFSDLNTEAWFDYNLSKIVSITSSSFTYHFDSADFRIKKPALFDARAFNIPAEDVPNYFLWRMKDWERNSLMMYCQSFFSHKDLLGRSKEEQHDLLQGIGKNWAMDLSLREKNGAWVFPTGDISVAVRSVLASEINYNAIDSLLEGGR
jgi:tRNA(His) guanylyltransferase